MRAPLPYFGLTRGQDLFLTLFGEVSGGVMFERSRGAMRDSPLGRRDADAPAPTQEVLRGVWLWLKTLADMGGQRQYR